jgi:hypothetical protein
LIYVYIAFIINTKNNNIMQKTINNIIFTLRQNNFLHLNTNFLHMKNFIIVCSILLSTQAAAQWRLQAQGGIAYSLKSINKDSVFSAKSLGLHAQLRGVYYWGHLGLGAAIGYTQRSIRNDANKKAPPNLFLNNDSAIATNGGVKAVYVIAGPEFCIACGDKLKLNFGIRAGVSFLQKKALQITKQSAIQYQNEIISKAPFTFNMGVAAHYFTNAHIGFGAAIDYHSFCVKANNKDIRRGINNNLVLRSAQHLLHAGISLTYKF